MHRGGGDEAEGEEGAQARGEVGAAEAEAEAGQERIEEQQLFLCAVCEFESVYHARGRRPPRANNLVRAHARVRASCIYTCPHRPVATRAARHVPPCPRASVQQPG